MSAKNDEITKDNQISLCPQLMLQSKNSSIPTDLLFVPQSSRSRSGDFNTTSGDMSNNLLVIGYIDGSISSFNLSHSRKYTANTGKSISSAHRESCRALDYLRLGDKTYIISASKDRSWAIFDLDEEKIIKSFEDSHDFPLTAIKGLGLRFGAEAFGEWTSGCVMTGDENGCVKLWNIEKDWCLWNSLETHSDYISCIVYEPEKSLVFVTSGDGTMSVIDLRKIIIGKKSDVPISEKNLSGWNTELVKKNEKKEQSKESEEISDDECVAHGVIARGDHLDSDILACEAISKSSSVTNTKTHIICGTQEGVLGFYNWSEWSDVCDRFVGHPQSIDTMKSIQNENFLELNSSSKSILITGSSDGYIRAFQLFPNQFLGIVGDCGEDGVGCLKLDTGAGASNITGEIIADKWLACTAHDEYIRIWDLESILTDHETSTNSNSNKTSKRTKAAISSKVGGKRSKLVKDGLSDESITKKKTKRSSFFDDLQS